MVGGAWWTCSHLEQIRRITTEHEVIVQTIFIFYLLQNGGAWLLALRVVCYMFTMDIGSAPAVAEGR